MYGPFSGFLMNIFFVLKGSKLFILIYNAINDVSTFFSAVCDPILMILAGNEDIHNSLDVFEFDQNLKTDYRVICP